MNKKLIAQNLVNCAKALLAIEFDSEDAMKKYLKDHPGADKSLHTVKKENGDKKTEKKPSKFHAPQEAIKEEINKLYDEIDDFVQPDGLLEFVGLEKQNYDDVFDKLSNNPTREEWDKAWGEPPDDLRSYPKNKQVEIWEAVKGAVAEGNNQHEFAEDENGDHWTTILKSGKISIKDVNKMRDIQGKIDALEKELKGPQPTPKKETPKKETKAEPHKKVNVKKNSLKKVQKIMDAHDVEDDSDELKEMGGFKKTLGQRVPEKDLGKYFARNEAKLKAAFLQNMDQSNYSSKEEFDRAKKRIKEMPVSDFGKVLAAINEDEE